MHSLIFTRHSHCTVRLFDFFTCVEAGRSLDGRCEWPVAYMTRCILSLFFIQCNATCAIYNAAQANCTTPHCGCNAPFLQAEGNCLVCQTTTPEDAATVQFLLDGMVDKIGFNFRTDSVLQRRSVNATVRKSM
jgi:hypothetical protein